jgi:tRNA threonylcarbamoyladenosine modification (KEOPS) complex Cgi121 subunit
MFSVAISVFALLLAGQAIAAPMPMPMRRAALEEGRLMIRATTAPDGIIKVYERQISDSIATMSKDGNIVEFKNTGKRQISDSIATMSKDGNIVEFKNTGKRQISDSIATMSKDGNIVEFKNTGKRQISDSIATMSKDGNIVEFKNTGKRQISDSIATMSKDGNIVEFITPASVRSRIVLPPCPKMAILLSSRTPVNGGTPGCPRADLWLKILSDVVHIGAEVHSLALLLIFPIIF